MTRLVSQGKSPLVTSTPKIMLAQNYDQFSLDLDELADLLMLRVNTQSSNGWTGVPAQVSFSHIRAKDNVGSKLCSTFSGLG